MKKVVLFFVITVMYFPIFAQPGTKYDISGKWYAYNAAGKRQETLDMTIYYNEDIEAYYAQNDAALVVLETEGGTLDMDNPIVLRTKTYKLQFDSDSSFHFDGFWRMFSIGTKNMKHQSYLYEFSCALSLRYIPSKNKIVGRVQYDGVFEALGNTNYKLVRDAVNHGAGNVLQDCDGDCGGIDVVYRR